MKRIYLDHAATTPVDPRVLEKMLPYFTEVFANPSSAHAFGQEAKKAVEDARACIAVVINAHPDEIVFTSGGSESNNFAVKGIAQSLSKKGNHIITSSIEHHSVLETCKFLEHHGFEVTYLPVDSSGMVDPFDVEKALTSKTILISIMHANNEIGTIQPIEQIGAIALGHGICFHTDSVQTLGYLRTDVQNVKATLMSAAAHKFYGPKGVGMLYVREGTALSPLIHGGDQERHRRGSTLNVPGIIGMAAALELASTTMNEERTRLIALRDELVQGILSTIPESRLNGHTVHRLPHNVHVSFRGLEGSSLLIDLDARGITCSTGAACTTAHVEPSHVLTAIGLSEDLAHGSLRFSLGRSTTKEDIDRVLEVLPPLVHRVRSLAPSFSRSKVFVRKASYAPTPGDALKVDKQ